MSRATRKTSIAVNAAGSALVPRRVAAVPGGDGRARGRGRPRDEAGAAQRREAMLDAATRHFAEHGYHGTDVQRLADELKTGKGTVYRHFPTKESLFLAAVDRVMVLLNARIDALRATATDPLALIAAAIVEYLAFFDAHPRFVELLIQERAVFRDRKKPTYFEHRERNVGRWRAMYRELIDAGRVRCIAPDRITDVISSALYGTMFTNFFAGRRKSLQTQASQIVDVVFNGILSTPERARRAGAGDRKVKDEP